MATTPTSISYYTLEELIAQRSNCATFGMSTAGIEHEIALVVNEQSMAARLRHPSSGRIFDQDA